MNCKGPCGKSFEGNTAGITISRRGWCANCEMKSVPDSNWPQILANVDKAISTCKFTFEGPPNVEEPPTTQTQEGSKAVP